MNDRNQSQPTKQSDSPQEKTEDKNTLVKNPNPRANENLTGEERREAETEGAGSEITDGEDA